MNTEKIRDISNDLALAKDKITRMFGHEKMTEKEIIVLAGAIDDLTEIQNEIEELISIDAVQREIKRLEK